MRRFWADQKGSLIITYALTLIPVLGLMGAAVDYSRANLERTRMQVALDATGLFLSKLPANTNQTDLLARANEFFSANYYTTVLTGVSVSVTPGDVPGKLALVASGNYKPKLVNVLGVSNFNVATKTEVKWGTGKVEVALVLDNSGSMGSQGRMTELKKAAHDLLNVLQNAAQNPGDAKVAIIPFDSVASPGVAGTCSNPAYTAPTTCESNGGTWTWASWISWSYWNANIGTCSKSSYKTQSSCQSNGGTWTPANKNTWEGCVWDRTKNYDVQDTAPDPADSAKLYPAVQCGNTINSQKLVQMIPLSTNWTALHAKVDAMAIAGYTNITIGLVWGFHALSPSQLMTEGAAYGTDNLTKFIVLMTDGDNTQNRFGDSTSTMNTRTSTACTNIKAAGIKIYTIRLISGNATLLQNCASSSSMYFDVQDASQLAAVFNAIGSQIANLHLSK
jgi:Flp pilus assembly protein TadG